MKSTYLPFIAVWFALASVGCASYDASLGLDAPAPDETDGTTLLYSHNVKGARDAFELADNHGGVAVTSLLLLPYSDAMTALLTGHLGARDGLDAKGDVLWGRDGFAYYLSRGVAWDDSPSTVGIKTLLIDRLPWTQQELDSVDRFVDRLNRPVTLLLDTAVLLADDLGEVAEQLDLAATDRETLFIPGEVFYDPAFSLTLGAGEFTTLRAVVEGVRASIYFVGAYEHSWTLRRAFGTAAWQEVIDDPEHPEHVDGFEVLDYQVAHLNASLGRAIGAADRLQHARTAAATSLRAIAEALRLGVQQEDGSSLHWRRVRGDVAENLAAFFDALAASTDAPTALPHVSPTVTADLSRLFAGPTVAADQDLFYVDAQEHALAVDENTAEALVEGVFEPALDDVEFTTDDSLGDVYNDVTRELFDRFEAKTSGL